MIFNLAAPPSARALTIARLDRTINPTLDNNSWEAIKEVAELGLGARYWNLGDTKSIQLVDENTYMETLINGTYEAQIIGFNHNPEYEGEHSIHFCLGQKDNYDYVFIDGYYQDSGSMSGEYYQPYQMNASNSNEGGWENSIMRISCLVNFKDYFTYTDDNIQLMEAIRLTPKYSNNLGGGSCEITKTEDLLFLPSAREIGMGLEDWYSNEWNYTQPYAYFPRARYSNFQSTSYEKWSYWLRTAHESNSQCFAYYHQSGDCVYAHYAKDVFGITPCFSL